MHDYADTVYPLPWFDDSSNMCWRVGVITQLLITLFCWSYCSFLSLVL